MKKFLRDNGLSVVLALLFLLFWAGQAVVGLQVFNEDARRHGERSVGMGEYLTTGHFWQATAENWESEFLQMGAYIVLTTFLFQRGSAESHDPDRPDKESPAGFGWAYRNGLLLAFSSLFLACLALHACEGLEKFNDERNEHGEPVATLGEYLAGPEFWFESLQNWQSEFLAVLAIVVFTIFLRQQNSPESKKLTASHSETGK